MADDFSELRGLAADLSEAPNAVVPFARKAIQVTSQNIKDSWRKKASRRGLERYAADITYETEIKSRSVEGVIGPTIGDAGSFGFVEDGGSGVLSAPQHAGRDALEENEDDFVAGMENAISDALRAVGL